MTRWTQKLASARKWEPRGNGTLPASHGERRHASNSRVSVTDFVWYLFLVEFYKARRARVGTSEKVIRCVEKAKLPKSNNGIMTLMHIDGTVSGNSAWFAFEIHCE